MSDIKYYKLKIGEIKSGIQMLDRLTAGNLSHHKNYLRNLLELYLKETEDLANEANKEQDKALNKHIVSNNEVAVCCANCSHFGTGDNWPCNDCFQYIHFKPKQTDC